MIPIAIVTRNRAAMLNATLRSISGSILPHDQLLRVFDDCSDCQITRQYLYTSEPVEFVNPWPRTPQWSQAGLDLVHTTVANTRGLLGRVPVTPIGGAPRGVVWASFAALDYFLTGASAHDSVVLLQDDVIFNANWMDRLLCMSADRSTAAPRWGLISGVWLNHRVRSSASAFRSKNHPTAQCWLIRREAWESVRERLHASLAGCSAKFDCKVAATVASTGAGVYNLYPAIGQHIGTTSLVRPKWRWTIRGRQGRIDYTAKPPYVISDDIRVFAS